MVKRQKESVRIDEKAIRTMEHVLSHGDRVELIPVKNGVKVIQVQRKEIKENRPDYGAAGHMV